MQEFTCIGSECEDMQLKLGEEYLSDVCPTYLQMANVVNGVLEKSATMYCPVAARLALLNPDIMEFDEIEELETIRNLINLKIDTHQLSAANDPQRYFWELRMFTIYVLQNRQYRLAERLIILGMFYQRLQGVVDGGKLDDIPSMIATYQNLIDTGELKEQLAQIPTQVAIQMELLKELTDERVIKGVTNQRYLECFAQFLHGIQYAQEASVKEITARYQEAEEKYYRPFMTEHEHIIEHYMVNHVFKNLFPLGSEKNIFENYVMLIVHYALIKMHLIGMSAFHKGLNEELVIKLIQSFTHTIEYNNEYLQHVLDLLKQNDYTTMAYMAILIKN
jgi:lysine-N-methylase